MTKAVAYLRCASNDQSETSIQYQRACISKYCTENSIVLAEEYVDIASSGIAMDGPAFRQLTSDVQKAPEWDTVLVYDLSRLGRRALDVLRYESLLNSCNIKIVSVTQETSGSWLKGCMELLEYYKEVC